MLTSVPAATNTSVAPENSDDFVVTSISFDSEFGWQIELARPKVHFTDNTSFPAAAELPTEARDALFRWLAAAGK